MVDKKFCDRCGKQMETYNNIFTSNLPFKHPIAQLCHMCFEEFLLWIKKGGKIA